MSNLHEIQMLILRELLFNPNSKFSQLNIQKLNSDHFSYHVNTLIQLGFVIKKGLKYTLTIKGKEFANQMDTDEKVIEKQPKIAVMLIAKKVGKNTKYFLIQERTKEPYFGFYGFLTGKVRFGEKVLETAKRELKEESGLECNDFEIKKIVHNLVRDEKSGELLEDKIFFIVVANNPTGQLIDTRGGKNMWITTEEFNKLEKKYYDEDNIFSIANSKESLSLEEETYFINEF